MISVPIIGGLIASMLHVLSGPDHLAAVTPITIESNYKFWRIGFFWGTGHLLGMLIIGLLFFLFKEVIPVESISGYSEQLVAIVLIGIGLWSLYKLFIKEKVYSQYHIPSDRDVYVPAQEHTQGGTAYNNNSTKNEKKTTFGIGILHGLAGVAHFLLLLPALGFETRFESIQYIAGFAIGTVIAMTLYTYVLGLVTKSSNKNKPLLNTIRVAGGFFALVIGIYWIFLTF